VNGFDLFRIFDRPIEETRDEAVGLAVGLAAAVRIGVKLAS
jgi:hypothetical protein